MEQARVQRCKSEDGGGQKKEEEKDRPTCANAIRKVSSEKGTARHCHNKGESEKPPDFLLRESPIDQERACNGPHPLKPSTRDCRKQEPEPGGSAPDHSFQAGKQCTKALSDALLPLSGTGGVCRKKDKN